MARADLLVELVKAGRHSPDPKFRSVVEAVIADERAKQHTVLANHLSAALVNGAGLNGTRPNGTVPTTAVVGDLLWETAPTRALGDLVLPENVATECALLIQEHHRADLLRTYGLAPRHRVLLVGPPGNGKTTLAQALAHELMVPLLLVRYEGLIGSYLGETAARLRKVFDYARQRACVLFLDEFDVLGKERGDIHETGEIKRVVSTLLLQMDALPAHVVVVTATNHAELLDRAVWRRFQLRLNLPFPTPAQAELFLNRLLSQLPAAGGTLPKLGRQLAGASFSEIEELFTDVARRVVLDGPEAEFTAILRDRIAAWRLRVTPADQGR